MAKGSGCVALLPSGPRRVIKGSTAKEVLSAAKHQRVGREKETNLVRLDVPRLISVRVGNIHNIVIVFRRRCHRQQRLWRRHPPVRQLALF